MQGQIIHKVVNFRVAVLLCDTLTPFDTHYYSVTQKYFQWFKSYGVYTKCVLGLYVLQNTSKGH